MVYYTDVTIANIILRRADGEHSNDYSNDAQTVVAKSVCLPV